MARFAVLAVACALLALSASAIRPMTTKATGLRRLTSCQAGCSAIMASASDYAVLASTTITSTGPSILTGDCGLYPGTDVVGFPPGKITGTLHVDDAPAVAALSDANKAYAALVAMPYPAANDKSGQDLVGQVLYPGKYFFAKAAQLSGNLTFDAQGDITATFVIQTGTTFVTSAGSLITLANGAQSCNIFYAVGTSATIGAATDFSGTIVADQSIVLFNEATVAGSLIGLQAAVTLAANQIAAPGACTPSS